MSRRKTKKEAKNRLKLAAKKPSMHGLNFTRLRPSCHDYMYMYLSASSPLSSMLNQQYYNSFVLQLPIGESGNYFFTTPPTDHSSHYVYSPPLSLSLPRSFLSLRSPLFSFSLCLSLPPPLPSLLLSLTNCCYPPHPQSLECPRQSAPVSHLPLGS